MWTRRLLLATMVAAAAMSLPRHVPASSSATFAVSSNILAVNNLR